MKVVILLGIIFYQISISVSQNDTQCIENPTGEVTLNVRGVPGPEGKQGPKGDIGLRGIEGLKGDRGEQGEKGEHGVIGPMGLKGTKGNEGRKGQKGVYGPQGNEGPPGSPGFVGPRGNRGPPGHEGPEGPIGPPGPAGHPGPRGLQGNPGDTVLNDEELDRVTTSLHNSLLGNVSTTVSKLLDTIQTLNQTLTDRLLSLESQVSPPTTVCNITSADWKRIAYFDTTRGNSCPTGLRTVTNTSTNQRACGRTANGGCTSLQFSPDGNYTNVCGRVRGYQYHDPEVFNSGYSIDSHYLHGVSITHGTPRTHLWSYVAGSSEQRSKTNHRCPCARPDPTDRSDVPAFVGEDFYCESGFSGSSDENRIAWEDPLWDGQGCFAPGNQCCNRYGWFHREIPATSDNIEVRWCADATYTTNEDVLTDQLEIWVM